jgi:hypothetical protein
MLRAGSAKEKGMEVEDGKYWGGSINRRPFKGCELRCPSCELATPIEYWEESEYWCHDCEDTHYCYVCPKCEDYHGPNTGGTIEVVGEEPEPIKKPARPPTIVWAVPPEKITLAIRSAEHFARVSASRDSVEILGELYTVVYAQYDEMTNSGYYTITPLVPLAS